MKQCPGQSGGLVQRQPLACGRHLRYLFKLIRDVSIFTNKRLILVDKQELTGKKIDYLSSAYNSISRFGIETAGRLDLNAELKIWVADAVQPSVMREFNRQVTIYDLQKVLAQHVLL